MECMKLEKSVKKKSEWKIIKYKEDKKKMTFFICCLNEINGDDRKYIIFYLFS